MNKIKSIIKRIFGGYDLNDLTVLAGLGIFGWGVWEIYPPAAMILAGLGLASWGYYGHRRKTRSKQ